MTAPRRGPAPLPSARPVTASRPPVTSFLTVAEVAARMRVSKMTIYRLIHGCELTAVRVGRSFRVPERALAEYLQAAETGDGS